MYKKILFNYTTQWLIEQIIYRYIQLLFATYKLKFTSDTITLTELRTMNGLFFFDTGHLLAGSFFYYKTRCVGHYIAESSFLGKSISHIATRFRFKNFNTLRSDTGISRCRQILDVLEINKRIYLVGDGKNENEESSKIKLSYFAAKIKVPLVYIECKSSSNLIIKYIQNNFYIPLPFSTIHIHIHPALYPTIQNFRSFNGKFKL